MIKNGIIRYIKKLGMARFLTKGKVKMTKSSKAVNYTAQNVENMVAAYSAATSDEARKAVVSSLAKELGKDSEAIVKEMSSGDYENVLDVFEREFGSIVTLINR